MCAVRLMHAEANSGSTMTALCPVSSKFRLIFFINLYKFYCNTVDMAYSNHSTDDLQYYIANNITEFKSQALLSQNQTPLRYPLEFPILLHYSSTAPRQGALADLWEVHNLPGLSIFCYEWVESLWVRIRDQGNKGNLVSVYHRLPNQEKTIDGAFLLQLQEASHFLALVQAPQLCQAENKGQRK